MSILNNLVTRLNLDSEYQRDLHYYIENLKRNNYDESKIKESHPINAWVSAIYNNLDEDEKKIFVRTIRNEYKDLLPKTTKSMLEYIGRYGEDTSVDRYLTHRSIVDAFTSLSSR